MTHFLELPGPKDPETRDFETSYFLELLDFLDETYDTIAHL